MKRLIRRRDGEVDKAAHFLDFFFFDELKRVEVLNFCGNLAGVLRDVEGSAVYAFKLLNLGDPANATFAGEQIFPHFFRGVSYATDQSDPSNDNPASQTYFPPFP